MIIQKSIIYDDMDIPPFSNKQPLLLYEYLNPSMIHFIFFYSSN